MSELVFNSKICVRLITAYLFLGMILGACSGDRNEETSHYFLDGYDDLEFQDSGGNSVPVSHFITRTEMNGVQTYRLEDTSLVLVNKNSEEPYTGYIRTFDEYRNNLQGEFEGGKINRLRYWHPNRTLGMDTDFREQTGTVWNRRGEMVANWNAKETYYIDPGTQIIRRIIEDSLTSYFDENGDLSRYTIRSDSAIINYYADGTPRFKFPVTPGGIREGEVKRWHPNGQLQVVGQYKNGWQHGTWIEYDSLGNEIDREVWN